MPNEALQAALQQSSGGFNTALQSIMQTTQNLQKAQYAKQQMAAELEQQKDLIDYRTDAQIRAQQEVYETVEKPQAQAKAVADFQSQIQEAYGEARETAQGRIEEFTSKYSNVYNYGFMDATFIPQADLESGRVEVKNFVNGQEVDYETYAKQRTSYKEVADFLDKMKTKADAGELGSNDVGVPEDGNVYFTQENAGDILRQVRTDPKTRDNIYSLYVNGKLKPFLQEETEGSDGRKSTIESDIFATSIDAQTRLGMKQVKQFRLQPNIEWGEDPVGEFTLDLRGKSIQGLQSDIQKKVFEPLGLNINELPLTDNVNQIIQGDTSGLSGVEKQYAEKFADIREGDEAGQVDELMWWYTSLPNAYKKWATEMGDRADVPVVSMQYAGFNPYANRLEDYFYDIRKTQNPAATLDGWRDTMRQ